MIAVDTNILIYSHRNDSAFHEAALACVTELAEGRSPWAIPWSCIHEFLAIVTHPRIFDPPTRIGEALDQVDAWLDSPSLLLLAEPEEYWREARAVVESSKATGPLVHDARIAAICVSHGVTELLTADRDFGRFGALNVRNPLVG